MSGESFLQNFDMSLFYEKRVRDYNDAQRSNGMEILTSLFDFKVDLPRRRRLWDSMTTGLAATRVRSAGSHFSRWEFFGCISTTETSKLLQKPITTPKFDPPFHILFIPGIC